MRQHKQGSAGPLLACVSLLPAQVILLRHIRRSNHMACLTCCRFIFFFIFFFLFLDILTSFGGGFGAVLTATKRHRIKIPVAPNQNPYRTSKATSRFSTIAREQQNRMAEGKLEVESSTESLCQAHRPRNDEQTPDLKTCHCKQTRDVQLRVFEPRRRPNRDETDHRVHSPGCRANNSFLVFKT